MNFKNQQKFTNFKSLKKLMNFIFAIFILHHIQSNNDYYVKMSICETIYHSSSLSSALSLSVRPTVQKRDDYYY